MRLYIYTYFIFTFISFYPVAAQMGILKGQVNDALSNQPLQGVSVNIPRGAITQSSDDLGNFIIEKVYPGKYELVVSHIGYQTSIIPIEIYKNATAEVDVQLNRAGLNLQEVKLTPRQTNGDQYMPAIDIMLRPVNTSQDVLRMVPGLFISQHAGGGKAEQIFLRGFDIDHGTDLLVQVDEMPMNAVSHAHGQGYADLHFLIPETIEKINFDKGPYQADKGNFATAGWVDFKTKDFLETNLVKTELGSYNIKRVVAMQKLFAKEKASTKQQLYAAGEYFISDGYFESPQDFHRFNLMLKYSKVNKSKSALHIKGSYFDSRWNASGQVPDRAIRQGIISRYGSIDDSEGGYTNRSVLNINHVKKLGDGGQLTTHAYFNNYHFDLYSNFTFFLDDPVNGDGINQQETRNTWGFASIFAKKNFIANLRAETRIGMGMRADAVNEISLTHTIKRNYLGTLQQGDIREQNYFAFAEEQLELSPKLTATAGIRADQFGFGYRNVLINEKDFEKQYQFVLSPKLKFAYRFNDQLSLYLKTGYGFHSNDSRVILDRAADKIIPTIFSTDLGMISKLSGNLLFKAAIWHMYSQQEFVYVGDGGFVEPGGSSERFGLDLSLRHQITNWLVADADVNLTRARAADAEKDEAYIPLAPALTSTGGLSAKTNQGLNSSIRYRYIDNRPADETNTVRAAGYMLLDALVSYQYKQINCSISIENILNSNWREAQFNTTSRLRNEPNPITEIHFTPGAPRILKASVALHF